MKLSDARLKRYGVSQYQIDKVYQLQRDLCACCDTPLAQDVDGVAVDHDHETGKIRGLLCRNCNTLIGRLGDTVDEAERKIAQVQRYLTVRRASVHAMLRASEAIERDIQLFEDSLSKHKTWMSRCASMLGFSLTFNGVAVGHRDETHGLYGIGVQLGAFVRQAFKLARMSLQQYTMEDPKRLTTDGSSWDDVKSKFADMSCL